jgi:hypothetical protein
MYNASWVPDRARAPTLVIDRRSRDVVRWRLIYRRLIESGSVALACWQRAMWIARTRVCLNERAP